MGWERRCELRRALGWGPGGWEGVWSREQPTASWGWEVGWGGGRLAKRSEGDGCGGLCWQGGYRTCVRGSCSARLVSLHALAFFAARAACRAYVRAPYSHACAPPLPSPALFPPALRSLHSPNDITWHEDNWGNDESRFLAFTLHHREAGDIYAAFNAHAFAVSAPLPHPPAGRKWCRLVDTNLPPPKDFTPGGNAGVDAVYGVQAFSSIVLIAKPI